jgi:hypothetical protein
VVAKTLGSALIQNKSITEKKITKPHMLETNQGTQGVIMVTQYDKKQNSFRDAGCPYLCS